MNDMTDVNKSKLLNDLRVVIEDAEELLRVTSNQASDGAANIRGRVQVQMSQAKADLLRLQHTAVAKVKATSHATDEYVHENPWKAIGAAAGAGLFMGLLVSRR